MQKVRWPYQLGPPFFGLDPSYREIVLEETFLLTYHMKMSHSDVIRMPIRYRKWFLTRLAKQFNPPATSAMDDMDTPLKKAMMVDK